MLVLWILPGFDQKGELLVMKRKYTVLPFGKREKRISVVLCQKPLQSGLTGMIRGKALGRDIAIVLDKSSSTESDCLYASLERMRNGTYSVRMTSEVLHGLRRGDAMARTCLFHELGHFLCKHLEAPGFKSENYDEERYRLASEGEVLHLELEADAAAADYLGIAIVAEGLAALRDKLKEPLIDDAFDPEAAAVAVQELNLRIFALFER
jgi:hypothetical protein